jgi:hypothetical protein
MDVGAFIPFFLYNKDKSKSLLCGVRQANARNSKKNKQAIHVILSEKERGKSFREIVSTLNELGYRTRRGKEFGVSSVYKLYNRAIA